MSDFVTEYVGKFRDKGFSDKKIIDVLVDFLDFLGVDWEETNYDFFESVLNEIPTRCVYGTRLFDELDDCVAFTVLNQIQDKAYRNFEYTSISAHSVMNQNGVEDEEEMKLKSFPVVQYKKIGTTDCFQLEVFGKLYWTGSVCKT